LQQLSRRLAALDSRRWAVIHNLDGVARGVRPHVLRDIGSSYCYKTRTRLTYSVTRLRDSILVSRVRCGWLKDCTNPCEVSLSGLVNQHGIVVNIDDSHINAVLHLNYAQKAQERRSKLRLMLYNVDLLISRKVVSVDNLIALFAVT
jgi:hypothetical protein